jgi:hypothetical protein
VVTAPIQLAQVSDQPVVQEAAQILAPTSITAALVLHYHASASHRLAVTELVLISAMILLTAAIAVIPRAREQYQPAAVEFART